MFNWLSSKPKSTLPEPNALEMQRSKQIQQLRQYHPNVSEIQRDLEYRVNTAVQGETYSLIITLPPRFPVDKPMVKVTPSMKHPWVDQMMNVTGSPSINNFAVHSDLGKAVKEVIEEFQRNPPVKLSQNIGAANRYSPYPLAAQHKNDTYPSYTSAYTPPYTSSYTAPYQSQVPMPTLPPSTSVNFVHDVTNQVSSTAHSNVYQPPGSLPSQNFPVSHTQVTAGSQPPPAAVPGTFLELQGLSDSELQTLLADETKLEKLVMSLPQVTRLHEEKETIIEGNRRQAIENLSQKPVLEEKKRLILEKYEYLNELKHTFDGNAQRQDDLLRGYRPQAIQDRLKIAAMQAEEESEAIAEQFLEGKIQMADFKRSYMEIRKLSHLRKAKEEKLHSVLLQYVNT